MWSAGIRARKACPRPGQIPRTPRCFGDEKTFSISKPNPALLAGLRDSPKGASRAYFLGVHDRNRNYEQCLIFRELWWLPPERFSSLPTIPRDGWRTFRSLAPLGSGVECGTGDCRHTFREQ